MPAWTGTFSNWDGVWSRQNVELIRQYPRVPADPDTVLYRSSRGPNEEAQFPSIARLQNGDLLVAFHLGTHNDNPAGKVLYTRSQDKGKTWSKPEVVYDIPGQDDREPLVIQTSDGTIWVGGWSMRFIGPQGDLEYTTVLSRSQDGGDTWSAPIQTSSDGFWRWLPGIQMSNGELLFLGAAADPESRRPMPPWPWRLWRATFVLRPDDKDFHWENYPQKVLGGLDEFSVVETNTPGTMNASQLQTVRDSISRRARTSWICPTQRRC